MRLNKGDEIMLSEAFQLPLFFKGNYLEGSTYIVIVANKYHYGEFSKQKSTGKCLQTQNGLCTASPP